MADSITIPLSEAMATARRQVDAALDRFTRFSPACPARLGEAIRYSLLAPGKRLRPILVLWGAEACGYQEQSEADESILAAACAVEMIHCYSLIHDDLPAMDDDDLRRGRPTCHKAFDEATAILAGDALLALAFEVLATHAQPANLASQCCALLARAAGPTALVGGQADDLAGQFSADGLITLQAIHERKTGAMIRVSLEIGCTLAEATPEQCEVLDSYGTKLGLAFQIADDLLDVRGDEAATGKRVGKDSEMGKLTFPGLLGVDESLRRAQRLIDEATCAIAPLGSQASKLDALARYVLERNH
ncbi:MAG: farnesyl diphosphate synthase [Planctomycetota bacterium]|nr:farnesyl diphosphate synthase [Planctomycetota bacterium]